MGVRLVYLGQQISAKWLTATIRVSWWWDNIFGDFYKTSDLLYVITRQRFIFLKATDFFMYNI